MQIAKITDRKTRFISFLFTFWHTFHCEESCSLRAKRGTPKHVKRGQNDMSKAIEEWQKSDGKTVQIQKCVYIKNMRDIIKVINSKTEHTLSKRVREGRSEGHKKRECQSVTVRLSQNTIHQNIRANHQSMFHHQNQ